MGKAYTETMKRLIATTFVIAMAVSPVLAQDEESDLQDGFNLMEEGAKMLMRGLMTEIEPKIDELRGAMEMMGPALAEFVREIGPAFAEMLEQVDDLRHYQAPEILPNGDIIIRRKPDAPGWAPQSPPDAIEL